MGPYRINFSAIPWDTPAAGIRFKAHEQNGRKLRLAEFTREFTEPDWCIKGHIGYILEGQMEIDFDGKTIVFSQGDGLFIPAGDKHKHKAKVLTDTVRVILAEDV